MNNGKKRVKQIDGEMINDMLTFGIDFNTIKETLGEEVEVINPHKVFVAEKKHTWLQRKIRLIKYARLIGLISLFIPTFFIFLLPKTIYLFLVSQFNYWQEQRARPARLVALAGLESPSSILKETTKSIADSAKEKNKARWQQMAGINESKINEK